MICNLNVPLLKHRTNEEHELNVRVPLEKAYTNKM
jgi:hypothetical protein